ncbi:MAG: thiamine-phosphate kinase [Archaeoglobaceae archaeon]|nr:thiamine-phosphate kinase [Archaeoglobaceae archaeon]MDW7989088.1 thiamine-phosphate kinase [Archaeoglobaceae archaeon]
MLRRIAKKIRKDFPRNTSFQRHMKEFELLKIAEELFSEEKIEVPAGKHDSALLRYGSDFLVFTCDTVNEISDFPKFMKPEEYGKMIVAVTLSDLAGSGAKPMVFLNSISIKEPDKELFRKIMLGIKEWAKRFDVRVAGGDIDFSPIITISGFAVGVTKKVLTRKGAKPGDKVFITGPLGKAQLCLEMLEKGCNREELPYAENLYTPIPRISEGIRIADFANSITDISDSLAISAHLMANASRVKIVFEKEKICLDHLSRFVNEEKAIELFLYGGGDYELLFTAQDSEFGMEIGRVERGIGVYLDEKRVLFKGYSHF